MVSETEGTINYDKYNEELVVRRKSVKIKPPFSAIGELASGGQKQKDIFDLLDQVSKGAFSLFTALKRCRNPNNNLVKYSTRTGAKPRKKLSVDD
jgi:hypothetical protein